MTFIAATTEPNPFTDAGLQLRVGGVGAVKPEGLHSLKQVHGTCVVAAQQGQTDLAEPTLQGDGIYTMEKARVIGVKTADCLPVVIASREKDFTSVLHAGWKGLGAGIVRKGLALACDYASKKDIFAFFGPCISLASFEVGPEVLEVFRSPDFGLSHEQLALALYRSKHDRWHIDLAMLGAFQLLNLGLGPQNITILRSCTYLRSDLWHSYRRTGSPAPSNWTQSWI